jgi:hypothetical protein
VTEAEYGASTHLEGLYSFIKRQALPARSWSGRRRSGRRRLRLLACGCCRLLVWHIPVADEARRVVEAAEEYADGRLKSAELAEVYAAGTAHRWVRFGPVASVGRAARGAMLASADLRAVTVAYHATRLALDAVRGPDYAESRRLLCVLLRDVFHYPPRPPSPLPATVLKWEKGTVVRLAQAAYDQRAEPRGLLDATRLSVLADALEDAGCTDPELVSHLRSPEPHVRGCWAVDLVRGKS